MDKEIELEARFVAHNYKPLPVVLTKGRGCWLWDTQGRRYLDMLGAYSAVNHGHRHPKLIKALRQQANRLSLVSRAFYTDKLGPFMEKLCELSGMDLGLPMNTGAEAVETAIKAARKWGYEVKGIEEDQAEIIVAKENFHGRTTTISGFSSSMKTRAGFGPFTPGFKMIPFGSLSALREAIHPNTCALLIEPIQGEAGVILPPEGWFKEVEALCKKEKVLLILDEVQSGLGRTGKLFAFQHEHIIPDGLILGKALGGGLLPVSAFLGKRELMQVFTPGTHGSTFGGNPLASAVGLEALHVLESEKLVEKSRELGDDLLSKLKALKSPLIQGIRGRGLWIGIDIDPEVMSAGEVSELLMKEGLLTKDTRDRTLRLAPPLVITREQIDWAMKKLKKVFLHAK